MADDYDGKKKPKSADPAARIVTPANAPARSRCELSTEDEEEDSDDGYSSDDDYAADAATPSRYRLSMKDEEEDFNDDSSSKNSEKTVALIDLSRDEDEDRSIFESIESAPKVRGKKSNAVIDLTRDEDEDRSIFESIESAPKVRGKKSNVRRVPRGMNPQSVQINIERSVINGTINRFG